MTPFAFGHFSGDPYHPDLATLSTYYPSHAPHSLGDATERDNWIINDISRFGTSSMNRIPP